MRTLETCERTLASLLFRKYALPFVTHGAASKAVLKGCYRQSRADACIITMNHNWKH